MSKAPRANARAIAPVIEELIVATRKELEGLGADAGAETIHWHLQTAGDRVPSTSSIYRLLQRRGFIVPEPRKRPRASYVRFEATLPNECWQSDMTHWQLVDGTGVEILTFIDDYSRRVLACDRSTEFVEPLPCTVEARPDLSRYFGLHDWSYDGLLCAGP